MIGDIVSDGIDNFFAKLVESCINMFLNLVNGVNQMTVTVLDQPVVNQGILYAQALAGSILAIKFTFEIWQNHILRVNGDSDADVQGTLMRTLQATAMMVGVPWITKQVYMWGTAIASDVALLPGTDMNSGAQFMKTLMVSSMATGGGILYAVAIIFALIVFLLVLVQSFIRAAELAMVAIVGAFMAIGLTNPNSQSFQTWWRELLNISLAQAIQLFMIKCSFFVLMISPNPTVPMVNIMLFAAFIWVTYKSPTILKQYMYSTGVGRMGGQAAQQAGSMVIMRKLMTKGAA